MFYVELPDHLIFHDDHPYSCGWWLDQEMYQWLKDEVGFGRQCGGWSERQSWMWIYAFINGRPEKNMMAFNAIEDALLFKLTWGGR